MQDHRQRRYPPLPLSSLRTLERKADPFPSPLSSPPQLDVQLFTHSLRDRIEWDLSSSLSPYDFSHLLAADLGLSSECVPLIAHAIHEELLKHKKDAIEMGLVGAGWRALPEGTSRAGPRKLAGVWRGWEEQEDFGPTLVELTAEDIERREVERERASRSVTRSFSLLVSTSRVRDQRADTPPSSTFVFVLRLFQTSEEGDSQVHVQLGQRPLPTALIADSPTGPLLLFLLAPPIYSHNLPAPLAPSYTYFSLATLLLLVRSSKSYQPSFSFALLSVVVAQVSRMHRLARDFRA